MTFYVVFIINFPLLHSIQTKIWDCCMQLFTGIRGKGAFLNGDPIKGVSSVFFFLLIVFNLNVMLMPWNFTVSSQTELISSLLATEVSQACYVIVYGVKFLYIFPHIFYINEVFHIPSVHLCKRPKRSMWSFSKL